MPQQPPRQNLLKVPGEVKGADMVLTGGVLKTFDTNGSAFLLNGLAAGAAAYQRVGRKVALKSVRLSGFFDISYPLVGTARGSGLIRIVVVWDKQPSGEALPTWNEVFGQTDAAGSAKAGLMDAIKYDEMGRFSILHEQVIKIEPSCDGNAGTVYDLVSFDKYVKLKGKESVYSGGTSGIGDLNSGGLYAYFRAADAANAGINVTLNSTSQARLRYVD